MQQKTRMMAMGPASQYITGMVRSVAHILFSFGITIKIHPAANTKMTAIVNVSEICGNMSNRHKIEGKRRERTNL